VTANPYGMARFEGKVALITGGASGIGRATAVRLAAEGAHVIIADLNGEVAVQSVEQIRADGGSASFMQVDLVDDAAVEACARAVASEVSALYSLVNNAALLR
jgi:NAD(P)-dependent dehydrogenase (short-subunit alcohol dehydrogenase family)